MPPRPRANMSWDWNDRDLTEWAKKTLPEFLLICMQDPSDKNKSIAHTPWEGYECQIAEVHIDGEANLIGKKTQSLVQFDLDIGMRLDIEKKDTKADSDDKEEIEPLYWPCVVQVAHFENYNMQPQLATQFEEVPKEVSDEVGWYVREGMGKHYLWHGLARWHAYAVKKWMKVEPPSIEDPYRHPVPPPAFPPFKEEERRRYEERIRQELLREDEGEEGLEDRALVGGGLGTTELASENPQSALGSGSQPFIGRKQVAMEEKPYDSPADSGDEEEYDPTAAYEYDEYTFEKRRKGAPPKMKKFTKYPFLPSMMCGVGGPSTDWLRPKEHAIVHPEWFDQKVEDKQSGVTHVDMILDKARKKREEFEIQASGKHVAMRASELCDAIEKGEIMKAFAKLDEQTTNYPHPQSGRCAVHYCVAKGSKELLQMVIEAKADLSTKDSIGQTALMMAAKQGSTDMTKILLDAGADATEEDSLGRSAGDMVKVLPLEPDNPLKNWREKMSGEPVPQDKAKKTHELRDMLAEKERPKKYGALLISAINQKDVRTAESSIENGGDLSMTDEKGDTALLLLAKGKWKDQEGVQIRLVERAHKHGANVNFQNGQGNTALLFAAHRGNQRLVEGLLALKADTSLTNSEGNTALMYAAHGGHEVICTALLEAFSPAKLKNKFGLTAAEMAQKRGFKSCSVLIQAYEMAPKKAGLPDQAPVRKKEKKEAKQAFDYSKWNSLEKEMQQDEQVEEEMRKKEEASMMRRPTPKMEDMGPEAFGLPPDTPWPPTDPNLRKKGPFDYSRWDKVVEDIEKHEKVVERYEHLQKNPQYEWRNGQKMQVIF